MTSHQAVLGEGLSLSSGPSGLGAARRDDRSEAPDAPAMGPPARSAGHAPQGWSGALRGANVSATTAVSPLVRHPSFPAHLQGQPWPGHENQRECLPFRPTHSRLQQPTPAAERVQHGTKRAQGTVPQGPQACGAGPAAMRDVPCVLLSLALTSLCM